MSTVNNTIIVTWDPPSYPEHTSLDVVYPGFLFGTNLPDARVDRYEVERYDEIEDAYVSVAVTYTPRAEFSSDVFETARVRIRSILRDGTITPWTYSGFSSLYGMTAEFESPNSTLLLSFI